MDASECARAVQVSLRTIGRWRVPPNWSRRDWREEARAQADLAALQADHDFDASRGVPLGAYLHQRVMGSVLTRYRQAWRFARRSSEKEPGCAPAATASERDDRLEELPSALSELSDRDSRIIGWLFWDGKTEAHVARELGISQPAVSKRKLVALHRLCGRLQHQQKSFRAGYIPAASSNVLC